MARERPPAHSPASSPARSNGGFAVVGWGIAVFAASRLVGGYLETTSIAAALAQAVIAEWGGGRLGVVWTESDESVPEEAADAPRRVVARSLSARLALGALLGAAAVAVVISFLASSGAVLLTREGAPLASLALSLFTSALYATRDELLLRGLTLRAVGSTPSPIARVVACGVVGAAAALGERGVSVETVFVELVLGLAFGALWVRDRGAWTAWSAHTAWLFGTAICLHGGLFEATVGASRWGGGDAGALAGSAAVVAVLPIAVSALAWATLATRRGPRVS